MVRAHCLVPRWPCSPCLLLGKETRKCSWASFRKALISFMRAPFSWPNHVPKALPSYTITLGFNIWNLERHKCSVSSSTFQGPDTGKRQAGMKIFFQALYVFVSYRHTECHTHVQCVWLNHHTTFQTTETQQKQVSAAVLRKTGGPLASSGKF